MASTMTVEINTHHSLCAAVFSADGECLLSGGDGVVQVWRVQDGKEMATMQTRGGVVCLAVSQDGSKIAAGTSDGDVFVWNAATYKLILKYKGDGKGTQGVDFSPNSTRLVSASENKTATILDIATSSRFKSAEVLRLQHNQWVTAAKYSPQGDRIATAGYYNSEVRVYDSNDGSLLLNIGMKPLAWHNKGLVWLNDQHLLVVSSTDNLVKQLDSSTGSTAPAEWAVPLAYSSYGSCISLPSHGKFLAYSTRRTVTFWDVLTHAQRPPALEYTQDIMSITISPDDRFLAIGGVKGKISITSLDCMNASIREGGQEDQRPRRSRGLPGSNPQPAFKFSSLFSIVDSILLSSLYPTFQESDFQVDDADLDLWEQDRLTETEAVLTANIATSRNPTHHAFVARAFVRARLQEWDTALEDAEKSIDMQPSVFGYIVKSIAHVCKGERDKGYRTCDMAFAHIQSSRATFLLLIKAIIVFMAGEHLDAISRVDDLIATATSNLVCYVIQAYMHLLIGNSRIERNELEGAIESYKLARTRMRHCKSQLLLLISLIFGWQFDNIGMTIPQRLCDALYEAGRIKEAVECFHQMTSELGGESNLHGDHTEWAIDFRHRSSQKLVYLGDSAANDQRHDEAITHYTTALSLRPSYHQEVLIKRAKVFLNTGSWMEGLEDANQAITLDPSSPWGYGMKRAALHKAGQYDDAVDAYDVMLSKIAESHDPNIQQCGDKYIRPSTTQIEIRKIVQREIRCLPRVLINTATGGLYDRAQQASAFESLPVFKELVSSMTMRIDHPRIKREVRQFFRYVMLSHKWEDNEPLFAHVTQTTVYDLEGSLTHDKLQMFCKIVRDGGFNWAWSDTCCINKSDHFVLQEALVAMFKWYQNAALVIVFLRGVHSWSEFGALTRSIWNRRAWTLQEYIAAQLVHFYTEDWTLYLDLKIPNHKESPEVISEMEQATGVSAELLMSLRPGLSNIREKLRLASTRHTTLVEDVAYSLIGILSVKGLSAIYGEEDASIGRLLANVLTGSGDVSILAWTGDSGTFNSCLPAQITVFEGLAMSHLPSPIPDHGMESIPPSSSFDLDAALTLYNNLSKLSAAWFVASRMKLPCIAFKLPSLSAYRTRSGRLYGAETTAFGTVEITTRQDISRMKNLYLVHPWLDALLEQEDIHSVALVENDAPPLSATTDDEISGEEYNDDDPSPLPVPEVPSHVALVNIAPMDDETRARRFVARLRRPFGALLLMPVASSRRGTDYKRIAADALIRVQFQESLSLTEILDNVRTLDVL